MNLKFLFPTALALLTLPLAGQTPVYLDNTADIEDRIEDVMKRLTLEEKVAMLHAQSKFSSPGVKRLGIPEIWMTDGPHGIRKQAGAGDHLGLDERFLCRFPCTYLSCGLMERRHIIPLRGKHRRRSQIQKQGSSSRTWGEHIQDSAERKEFRIHG